MPLCQSESVIVAPKYNPLAVHADDQIGARRETDGDQLDDAFGRRTLLADTAFSEGFGAAFICGKRESDGTVRSHREIPAWQVRLILPGPLKQLKAFETRQ